MSLCTANWSNLSNQRVLPTIQHGEASDSGQGGASVEGHSGKTRSSLDFHIVLKAGKPVKPLKAAKSKHFRPKSDLFPTKKLNLKMFNMKTNNNNLCVCTDPNRHLTVWMSVKHANYCLDSVLFSRYASAAKRTEKWRNQNGFSFINVAAFVERGHCGAETRISFTLASLLIRTHTEI